MLKAAISGGFFFAVIIPRLYVSEKLCACKKNPARFAFHNDFGRL
jgi:hypothetical protein